jgi:hypothetical protein
MRDQSYLQVETLPYARLAGVMYILTTATGFLGEGYIRGSLLVSDNASQTAQNIVGSELLFRISIVADIFTIIGTVVLVWALYQFLSPVDRRLAQLATFFRLVDVCMHASVLMFGLVALSFLGGGEYLAGFDASKVHGLAGFALRAKYAGANLGFIPLGLGSAAFALLLFRSGIVPGFLAVWGVLASLLLAIYALIFVTVPGQADYRYLIFPILAYGLVLGLWLLLQPVTGRSSAAA